MSGNVDEIISHLLERTREDKAVALLDPLQADEFLCTRLPTLNDNKDTAAILNMAEYFFQKSIELSNPGRTESLAVLRDLGFIAASLIRHGATIPDKLSKASLMRKIRTISIDTMICKGVINTAICYGISRC